jgi:type IV pilus assembly protein PilQ
MVMSKTKQEPRFWADTAAWLALFACAAGLLVSGVVRAQSNEVLEVTHQSTEGFVEFTMTMAQSPSQPKVFATETPPRIVLELPETDTLLPADRVPVDVGVTSAYTTLSAGGRTRLIVDLDRPTSYMHEVKGNKVSLRVAHSATAVLTTSKNGAAKATEAAHLIGQDDSEGLQLLDIDFRRSDDGGSKLVLQLSGSGASLAVREGVQQLLVELYNVDIPDGLIKTLDVEDFATPVQRISSAPSGTNARFTLDVEGAHRHLAYQSGNSVIVEVNRPPREEVEEQTIEFFQDKSYEGDRVTFNFQDIPVRSVLQLIADVSNLNIVVADSVQGNVTLRLTNVPWDQALDIILDTKNLDQRRNGNVIWIAPTAEIAAREQELLRALQDKRELEPLQTAIISVSYATAGDLKELIENSSQGGGGQQGAGAAGLLSERGSVSVDARTNTLLITDTAERIVDIRNLVLELDRPVRQVLIESRIVIARNNFAHALGVRFGVTSITEGDRGNVFSTSGSITANDRINNVVLQNRFGINNGIPGNNLPGVAPGDETGDPIEVPPLNERLNVNLPVASPAGSFGFSLLAADYLLDLELTALETEGIGEVISTPRVITANQAEAFIQQGVEIPFELATSSGATAIQFKEAVLELRVTPLITPDNRVQMAVGVKQDTVGQIVPTAGGGSVPSIDTRELSTSVLVDNGQTIVLGGIFQDERNYSVSKVPVLGDVPVLGNLFRRRSNEDEKRELLIFITPTILDDRVILN